MPYPALASARHSPFGFRWAVLFSSTTLATSWLAASPASAACTLTPTGTDDIYVCDSDVAGGLTDTVGNNTLQLPAGGTGAINGNVTFGAGADRVEMHSGTITGAVEQGDGVDTFIIGAGTVTGNVQQGGGTDDFQITGGQIGSLNQGDGLDTFFMSSGRIVDFFDDGDRAVMTGGRIGRVNMKLDQNYFNMSGGVIDRNLVTGFDKDTVIISGGTIGGNISVSGGDDTVTVTGGSIGGNVLMSFGQDNFTWDGGGVIHGAVELGGDADTATLRDLNNAHIGAATALNGGAGVDALTLDNVSADRIARLQNWETIAATNDTELVMDGTLTLGDVGTETGVLTVDATSTLFGGGGSSAVAAFSAGQLATLTNAGRIDLTNGGTSTADRFTVVGSYVGDGGMVLLQTVLGDDTSASDRLVVSGGQATGATSISIINVGGAGASTTQDGIMVVEAINGAITQSGTFALNGPVAAGAFEYLLFKGGVSSGSAENWYLRSTLVTPPPGNPPPEPAPAPPPLEPAPPPVEPVLPEPEPAAPPPAPPPPPPPPEATPSDPDPVDPAPPVEIVDPAPPPAPEPPPAEEAEAPPPPPPPPVDPAPVPTPTAVAPTPGATPVAAAVVPLYRIEVPTYSVVPPMASYLGTATLGTFHERRGEQGLLSGTGTLPATWARLFGQSAEIKWSGTVAPTFDGSLFGFQAGLDIAGFESLPGHEDRLGVFLGYARASGDVRGQALGWNDLAVGKVRLNGTSAGAYWTHIGPGGWYLDGVLMGTWYGGSAESSRGFGIDIDGTGITASIEGGYPIILGDGWVVEPQAQLIWQRLSLDDRRDAFSAVTFDSDGSVTGRLGVRLQGDMPFGSTKLQPYLKANLWHQFDADQRMSFDRDAVSTKLDGTSLEVGAGVIANVNDRLSLHLTGDYTTNLGGEKRRVWEGNVGLTIKW